MLLWSQVPFMPAITIPLPPLARRSPTDIAGQLNDLKTGARHRPETDLMKPVVAPMHNEDIIALAAFIGSLKP